MATDLEIVSRAYSDLLQLSPGTARLNLQPALSALRDEISYLTGHSAESVQSRFEALSDATRAINKITR